MGQFVQRGAIIVDLLEERGLRRNLHIIMRGYIEGTVAADAEIDARCGNNRFGDGHDLAFGERRGAGGDRWSKPSPQHNPKFQYKGLTHTDWRDAAPTPGRFGEELAVQPPSLAANREENS